jgi:hypothetical protein
MKHFILTRFNLKNELWKNSSDGSPKALSEEWLNNRFNLFETYCLPSVRNQINKNFIWILIFDSETPENFRKQIAELIKNDLNIKTIFVNGFKNLIPSLVSEIAPFVKGEKHIITTRLDNDDIIHKDFVDTIQHMYQPKTNLTIDLKKGYQLTLEPYKDLRLLESDFNPFLSLVEATENFKTVLAKEHLKWKYFASEHSTFKKESLWIQLIHFQNHANQRISYLKRVNTFTPSEFGLTINLSTYGKTENFFFNLKLFPKRFFESLKMSIKRRSIKKF